MKTTIFFLFLTAGQLCFGQAASTNPTMAKRTPFGVKPGDKLTITVHPGVELLSIIQYLSGNQGPIPSPYLTDVRKHFSSYRTHPAVLFLFNSDARFGYDLPELGWCFTDPLRPTSFNLPEKTYWYQSFSKAELTTYLTLCMDFAKQANFAGFYERHQAEYNRWGQAMQQKVDSLQIIPKLESFYRRPAASQWYICLDPLNSGGAHAIITQTVVPAYGDYIVYQQGYWNRQATPTTVPTFQADMYNLVWHEGSHTAINQLLGEHRAAIDSLSYLMKQSDVLARQNITDWRHFVDESVVRAISVALHRKHLTPTEAKQRLESEQRGGFVYTDQLAEFILTDYINSGRYASFDAYFPVLLKRWATLKV